MKWQLTFQFSSICDIKNEIKNLLEKVGWATHDVELFEINEALAAQTIGVMQKMKLDHTITNVNGGAIALGHPLGCSGARIITTLLHEMKRRKKDRDLPFYGLASLCVGVGQGVSTIVELIHE